MNSSLSSLLTTTPPKKISNIGKKKAHKTYVKRFRNRRRKNRWSPSKRANGKRKLRGPRNLKVVISSGSSREPQVRGRLCFKLATPLELWPWEQICLFGYLYEIGKLVENYRFTSVFQCVLDIMSAIKIA